MGKRKDIILLQPPFWGPHHFWKSESLGMGYLASSLEACGYSVEIIDGFLLELGIEEIVERIAGHPPRLLLGLSLLSFEIYRSGWEIVRMLRARGFDVHVTIGSWVPTFWHEKIIEEGFPADSIVLGEGENVICNLARYLDSGKWFDTFPSVDRRREGSTWILSQATLSDDLDNLPHPRRDYLEESLRRYHLATLYSARGCGHSRCSFCSVPAFYRGGARHRLRSAGSVLVELEQVVQAGADFVFFTDEDFIGGTEEGIRRALDIFEGASLRGIRARYTFNCNVRDVSEGLFKVLKECGLTAVYIGIETHLERCLKRYGKGSNVMDVDNAVAVLKEIGIKLVPGWILFERDTTLEEVEEELMFLRNLESYHVNYLKALYVMKDTPMERLYEGDIFRSHFASKYYFKDPKVDLLVRILMTDYLPEAMPHTAGIYPVWHKYLAGYCTEAQEDRFERINRSMKELSLGFVGEAIGRIRSGTLTGLARELHWHARQWAEIGREISDLSASVGNNPRVEREWRGPCAESPGH